MYNGGIATRTPELVRPCGACDDARVSADAPIDLSPDALPIALVRTDAALRVVWANAEAVALVGPEVLGECLLDRVDVADLPRATAFGASPVGRVRVALRIRSGWRRCELRGRVGADGQPVLALLEQAVDDLAAESEPLFTVHRDALVVVVPYTLEVVRGNAAAAELFGRAPSGWYLRDALAPSGRGVFHQRAQLAVERPEPFEVEVIARDGALVPVEGVGSRFVTPSGERWLLAFRDCRARQAARDERDRAERAQKRVGQEVATRAAAALRGPFAQLLGAFDRLQAGLLPEGEALAARARGQEVALALGQLGRTTLRAEQAFDLRDEVRAATMLLAHEAPPVVQLTSSLGDEPVVLRGDPAAWRAALTALGRQAAARVRFGGRVELALWCVRQSYWLEVRDNGPEGLAPEAADRMFEPFAHANGDLSLALVEATARVHGAAVTARSERGSGTTITFKGVIPEHAVEALPRLRILVVDDDPAVRRGLLRILVRHHDVLQADGGPEAFATLRAQEVDLVLCDLHLSGGSSGLDVCREVRRLRPNTVVVLMTGYLEHPNRASSVADAVLEKPFSYGTFAGVVRDVLRRGALARG